MARALGALATLIVGGIMAQGNWSLMNQAERHLRVAFPALRSATTYEPTKIGLSYEYIFLENIFSPLVEIDPKGGMVQPGIAEHFEWVGNELHLKIRSGMKTGSGVPITVGDVLFSLKRLIILSSNTHGNFKDLICPDTELTSVDQSCPGISQTGDQIILRPGVRKPFLLPMLASIDFAIIPRSSVDPKSLQIINYRETSGPYFVDRDDGSGKIHLRVNPYHYRFTPEIPQTVEFIPIDTKAGETSLQAFQEGRADHIMTTNSSKVEDVIDFARRNPDVQLHATMKIRNLILVFTDRGLKELSPEQRRLIGREVKAVFREMYKNKAGFQEANEFFPGLGHGGLTREQEEKVRMTNVIEDRDSSIKFRLGIIRAAELESWARPLKERLPNAEIYRETTAPDFRSYESSQEVPHAFIANTDTGFLEDIGLITYSMSAGLFGLPKKDRQPWLIEYMKLDSREARMDRLRELHAKALTEPALIPLIVSPFVALARKPWKMELSELYAHNQLWLIKRN